MYESQALLITLNVLFTLLASLFVVYLLIVGIVAVRDTKSGAISLAAALRDSEALNRRTLQALSAHIAVLDRQGRILVVNHAWAEFAHDNVVGGAPAV